MKPAAFDYIRADSAEEVVQLLAEYGDDARILAGGQSLIAALNMRLAQPRVLIDISCVADLSRIRVGNKNLTVGAAVTQAVAEKVVQDSNNIPLLAQAFPHLGHFQTRNRGTVCGSIAHADPSAELPLCLVTLGGAVNLRSWRRRRRVAASEFFRGVLTTARETNELVESVEFPMPKKQARYGFVEVSMRHGDFALVALAGAVSDQGVRLGVGGVADRPWVETLPTTSGDDLDAALEDLAWKLDARSDQHASARYRRHLVRNLGRKLITELSS
ncbi:MAG: FAD binding domain-containing protein [Betaproteobacteria bacterium]|jgi:2-furoyl-CoA dehydrogenase FAD binding subunit|nr:MAG: FAD binding domain-containing protein [Betaproteobacteria bacterium]